MPVNMRKSFDGFSGIVQHELKKDPLSTAVFIFLNRRRNQVKLLVLCKHLHKTSYEIKKNMQTLNRNALSRVAPSILLN